MHMLFVVDFFFVLNRLSRALLLLVVCRVLFVVLFVVRNRSHCSLFFFGVSFYFFVFRCFLVFVLVFLFMCSLFVSFLVCLFKQETSYYVLSF